jgi:hypothetical protein
MKNSSFIKFLFGDKEAMTYWTAFFIITLLFSLPAFLIGLICFIGIYSTSFYYFNKYFELIKYLGSKNVRYFEEQTVIKIYQKGFKFSGPLSNRQFPIAIEAKERTINIIKTQKGFCFFPYKRELGLFKIYQKPFVITKDKNTFPDYFYLQNRICKNIKVDNNNNVVINCKELYQDIEKMEITDNVTLVQYLSS